MDILNHIIKKVGNSTFEAAKNKLTQLLQSGHDNKIITKPEFEAMYPDRKSASKYYCNFKVHKEHTHIPQVSPIISGSGLILDNLSRFVDYYN